MAAARKAADEVYVELSAQNADFKKIYENQAAFRNDEYFWWQVAELTYDITMVRALSQG